MSDIKLGFIRYVGEDVSGNYIYEFLFTKNIDDFWGENFYIMPSCLCSDMEPNEGTFELIKTITTTIKLGLAQNSCCFSLQDVMDGISVLGYEDISEYTEYPEEGRLIFPFGDDYDNVEYKLAKKGIIFNDGTIHINTKENESDH